MQQKELVYVGEDQKLPQQKRLLLSMCAKEIYLAIATVTAGDSDVGKLVKKLIEKKEGLHLVDDRFQVYVQEGLIIGLLMTSEKFPLPKVYEGSNVSMLPCRMPKDTKYLFKKDMSDFLTEELLFSMQPNYKKVFLAYKALRGNVLEEGSFGKFVDRVKKVF